MALTISSWTETTVNGALVLESTSLATVAEYDTHSLKTPSSLDTSKAWFLHVNADAAALDGAALPVDIWGCTTSEGTLGVVSTSISNIAPVGCVEVAAAVIDDVKGVALSVIIDPNYTAAPVQTALASLNIGRINCGTFGSYIINCDGAGTLAALTCKFIIVQ